MLKQSIVAAALTFALASGAYAATSAPKEPAKASQHQKKEAAKHEKAAVAPK
ncbi:hypothetical protein [Sandaracinobacter neustonicus]|uniref:hypothetical protein n=1 Tax=Sandaracinobacter neustonicus TaxID=1715348 RepID=UPI0015E3C41C|nr:hypothetical protein [Sandaracinobacter neustonicus]